MASEEGKPGLVMEEHSFLEGVARKYRKVERDGESCWVGKTIPATDVSDDASALTDSQVQFPDVNEVLMSVLRRKLSTRFPNQTVLSPFTWMEDVVTDIDEDGVPGSLKKGFAVASEVPESMRNGFAFPTLEKPCVGGANLETLFEESLKWISHLVLVNPATERDTMNISNRAWYNVGKCCTSFCSSLFQYTNN